MTLHLRDASRPPARRIPLTRLPQPGPARLDATWRDAVPRRIEAALAAARRRDPGGWCVAAPSRALPARTSITRTVAGQEIALWRGPSGVVAGPGACPHMGALLDGCPVVDGQARCRWHGLALGPGPGTGWTPYPAHDDGLLVWVQLPVPGEEPSPAPTVPARPAAGDSVAAVIEMTGTCEPRDVIANRLDPWHGSWLHPYAFSHLTVDDDASDDERLVVDVAFRLNRTWGVPVRAEFSCPDARTIVMLITDGEGAGSVVETHATPLGAGPDGRARTCVTEATVAYSPRRGFRVARHLQPLLAPAMRRTARQLWIDDLAYAERRYELRRRADA